MNNRGLTDLLDEPHHLSFVFMVILVVGVGEGEIYRKYIDSISAPSLWGVFRRGCPHEMLTGSQSDVTLLMSAPLGLKGGDGPSPRSRRQAMAPILPAPPCPWVHSLTHSLTHSLPSMSHSLTRPLIVFSPDTHMQPCKHNTTLSKKRRAQAAHGRLCCVISDRRGCQ